MHLSMLLLNQSYMVCIAHGLCDRFYSPQMYLQLEQADCAQLRNGLGRAASTHFVKPFMWGWQFRDDCGILDMMRVAGCESMINVELGYWLCIIQHAPNYLQQKHGVGITNEACANF
jgi:hypothetical protein